MITAAKAQTKAVRMHTMITKAAAAAKKTTVHMDTIITKA
jgi:hypothetical protein